LVGRATPKAGKSAANGSARVAAARYPVLLSAAEQDTLSLEELARAILDRRARPGVKQIRRLAEAVLQTNAEMATPATAAAVPVKEPEKPKKSAAAKAGKGKKKKGKKKAGKGKLPKIPKLKT